MRKSVFLVSASLLIVGCGAPPAPSRSSGDAVPSNHVAASSDAAERTAALREAIRAARAELARGLVPIDEAELNGLYSAADDLPLWLGGDGAQRQLDEVVRLIEQAGTEGLVPEDYGGDQLPRVAATLTTPGASPRDVARADVSVSASVLRYMRHVHLGRVDPTPFGLRLRLSGESHTFAPMLRAALASGRVAEALAALAPPFRQYRALKTALAQYRQLAASSTTMAPLNATLRPGDRWTGVAALRHLLIRLGDLPADSPTASDDTYTMAVAAGVVAFQRRHELTPDGVVGPATLEALRVPIGWRVRQIELALERLRWIPDIESERVIVVNIPMFRLVAWDHVPTDGPPAVDMPVIVGRALDTHTPVFAARLSFVVFRPYWNVPLSILRTEILPTIARDPDYLAREQFEIVRGPRDDSPVERPTPEILAELGRTDLRLRQRPGPANALGLIKFMFPNENDVYLHGTPAMGLFRSARRDFSHGCIRVEDPARLAAWVLSGEAGWDRPAVDAAMIGPPNRRVDLSAPIDVLILYMTAAVDPTSGAVMFSPDLYGHDQRLNDVW